ncbi:unnamed protein product (macronuclear) [Paramecium tetraurelia]|uniref:Uncharacterized protein n=1 Tax=Paramecium tetraurelia TaxID=5888 RepID=A0E632_PARTE|nr:uncharacterized protein GSPATT00003612001 [Paramecium tetraurelia]CAK90749.1 unnamed protein product [Paramecium tetraurelia]|eukprot:XP_001458146.1 hypothetical protein (macronuclear) [Paramecium tetraurelia strain d4-2]
MLAFQSCNLSSSQQSGLSLLNVNQSHEIESSQSSSYWLQAFNQFPSQIQQKDQLIQQENQKLKNDNQLLQQQVNHLENKQQELIYEIHDLRQLIKRVYSESEMTVQFLKTKNVHYELILKVTLEHLNDSLEKALKNLQNNINMFGQLKDLSEFMKDGADL